ncbi:phage tail sheath C-terminal domain-containing protein [Amycolatopsis minnesotensis]|uniref:Tail sheath protein C-terminal domain-containing protein n=1 Tax=Amycolatopsis minnesotensis TaxID=337894 RepID=A0ABP5BZE5_9PSEU
MTEAVLPGVLVEVRPEALIVPGAITVGNVGVVGTAAKGPVNVPQLLGSYAAAVAAFGPYDRWDDGSSDELTLVRAIEQAYKFGATTVWAVRVASSAAATASRILNTGADPCVTLTAASPGSWGNDISVEVKAGAAAAFVTGEEVTGPNYKLAKSPIVPSASNRIAVRPAGGGSDRVPVISYDSPASPTGVRVDTDGTITFGTKPGTGDKVIASYTADKSQAATLVVKAGTSAVETYHVVSGDDLVADVNASSTLVEASAGAKSASLPEKVTPTPLAGGVNGQAVTDYSDGLAALLTVDAHLIVAAGQSHAAAASALAAHCDQASADEIKRDRIAIVGTAFSGDSVPRTQSAYVAKASGHSVNSDRVVLVTPGIRAVDRGQDPVAEVTLPGSYAAAAIAGMLAAQPPHISLTNKVLQAGGLEYDFTPAELKQLVLSRALTLEKRQGFRIVRGITTSTNTAWTQITTRRIVDYAKLGVRSAATPYIGLLNNERVRGALKATINGFLAGMVEDEMLVSYELDVHASREDEIRGRVLADMVIRPTFSIDFIKVTMFLE